MQGRGGLDGARTVITRMIAAAMQEHRVPGVAIGVHRDGEEWIAGFGVTNVEHPLPVDADTLFQVGSTTKTLTALAVMRLVEQGRLQLDVPIRSYLPDLELATRELSERVTLEHLLSHSAGFDGDMLEDFGPGDDALARAVERMRELPSVTPLGRVWNYSNAGFALAGRVMEAVTGQSYERSLKDLVLEPLGMDHSFFFAADAITHTVAMGHKVTAAGPTVHRPWQLPRAINPAGGLISSVRDQLRYARFHLGDGRATDGSQVLSASTLLEMRRPRIEAGGGRAAFGGLGWLIQRTPGVLAHGGSTLGQESSFVIVPEQEFAVTVLTNADRGVLLHQEIVKWALRNLVELDRVPVQSERLTGPVLATYVGQYQARLQRVEIEAIGGMLSLRIIPSEHCAGSALGEPVVTRAEVFVGGGIRCLDGVNAGQRGEFLGDAVAPGQWLRLFGRVHTRVSAPP